MTGKLLFWLCAVAAMAGPAPAADYDLDRQVEGKPALEREVPVRIDVVGYDVEKIPQAKAQLQAVANAGGGAYSGAGIREVGQVMSGVVSGTPAAPPAAPQAGGGSRLQWGAGVIYHGKRGE